MISAVAFVNFYVVSIEMEMEIEIEIEVEMGMEMEQKLHSCRQTRVRAGDAYAVLHAGGYGQFN